MTLHWNYKISAVDSWHYWRFRASLYGHSVSQSRKSKQNKQNIFERAKITLIKQILLSRLKLCAAILFAKLVTHM